MTAGPGSGRPFWLRAFALMGALAAVAVLVSMGNWQVERMRWKQELAGTIQARTTSEARPLADIVRIHAETGDVDYLPVELSGTFLHDRELYLLATHQGQSGWHVYTPLETVGEGIWLVNRGFVPFDRRDPATRADGQIEGEVSVTGLARAATASKPGPLVPENRPESRESYWKDLPAMARAAGLPPPSVRTGSDGTGTFFIDARADPVPGGLPVGGVTTLSFPDNHLQYAVTWYGLALALVAVLAAMLLRAGGVLGRRDERRR